MGYSMVDKRALIGLGAVTVLLSLPFLLSDKDSCKEEEGNTSCESKLQTFISTTSELLYSKYNLDKHDAIVVAKALMSGKEEVVEKAYGVIKELGATRDVLKIIDDVFSAK